MIGSNPGFGGVPGGAINRVMGGSRRLWIIKFSLTLRHPFQYVPSGSHPEKLKVHPFRILLLPVILH